MHRCLFATTTGQPLTGHQLWRWERQSFKKRSSYYGYLWFHGSMRSRCLRVSIRIWRLWAWWHWRLLRFGLSRLRRTLDVLPIPLISLRRTRMFLAAVGQSRSVSVHNVDRSEQMVGFVSFLPQRRDDLYCKVVQAHQKGIWWCRHTSMGNKTPFQGQPCYFCRTTPTSLLEGRQHPDH